MEYRINSEDGAFFVWHTSKVKTFKDAFTTPVYLGSSGPNDSEFYPALANNILGTQFALVRGYKFGPEVRLAIERGEVEGQSQTWDSVKHASPELIQGQDSRHRSDRAAAARGYDRARRADDHGFRHP